ncbi:serine/threonine-protein phosphatase 4 regulatory subunit 2-like isoform X1 [Huso huso]|uniref:Serine/threonine-protein phosphatase 4 regulatory subunit 2-like isoform X1 n=1 Tax=Huso huso TaxID=61971 RepID=A0ABR0Z764_HUSHU
MEIDTLLEALKDFEKEGKKEVCPVLDQFLCHVAKTGETICSRTDEERGTCPEQACSHTNEEKGICSEQAWIQWSQFKSYFLFKLEKVMDDFRASAPEQRGPANPNVEYIPFEKMKERILKIVDGYNGIPFTIQRLCELLTDPKRNYAGTDKFLRGVEKNVMVVSCVYPTSEKNGSSSLNRMNGVMFPGNSPGYSDRTNVNGPGTPRPMIRPKLSLSSPLATNGLPDSTENKEPTVEQTEEKTHGESSTEEEGALGSPVKNKHLEEEDPMEAEGHEVKRLKFDKEEEEKETPQAAPSESSSEMPEEAETSSADQEGEKESSQCADQQGLQEEEPSSTQTKIPDGPASDEKVQSEVSAGTEDSTEESNQMDQSEEQTQPEKDLSTGARETTENTAPVSSTSEECSANEEPGTTSSAETPEIPSESAMENGTEATDTAEEPMEQD